MIALFVDGPYKGKMMAVPDYCPLHYYVVAMQNPVSSFQDGPIDAACVFKQITYHMIAQSERFKIFSVEDNDNGLLSMFKTAIGPYTEKKWWEHE